jgi:hypothetical protein
MSDVTYVLVEIEGEEDYNEIKNAIEGLNKTDRARSYYVAESKTVSMDYLENAGTPTIYFP